MLLENVCCRIASNTDQSDLMVRWGNKKVAVHRVIDTMANGYLRKKWTVNHRPALVRLLTLEAGLFSAHKQSLAELPA